MYKQKPSLVLYIIKTDDNNRTNLLTGRHFIPLKRFEYFFYTKIN